MSQITKVLIHWARIRTSKLEPKNPIKMTQPKLLIVIERLTASPKGGKNLKIR